MTEEIFVIQLRMDAVKGFLEKFVYDWEEASRLKDGGRIAHTITHRFVQKLKEAGLENPNSNRAGTTSGKRRGRSKA